MIFGSGSIIAVFLLMASSLVVLASQRWRYTLIALAVQYLAAFWLVAVLWPPLLAAVKLVVGWMAVAMISATRAEGELEEQEVFPGRAGQFFRLLAAAVVWLLVFSASSTAASWLPAQNTVLWGSLVLIGTGLLQLGMTTRPLRVVIGLLTVLSGFEIVYAAVETSVLVTGLLAIITLGLALAGSYLVSLDAEDEE